MGEEMEKEKMSYFLKVLILMGKNMEKEQNIILHIKLFHLMENFTMEKYGMENYMMKMEIY